MARIKKRSRHMALLIAFMSVVVTAGGLMGAIAGAVCILLFRSMFNMSTGIGEFILATVSLGAILAFIVGVMLTAQRPFTFFTRGGAAMSMVAIAPAAAAGSTTDGK